MDFELINERVKVVAVFDNNLRTNCRPIKFLRPNKTEINITEIGLVYPKIDGSHIYHIFDVTDGKADYRLEFDSKTLVWRLTAIGDVF